MLRLLTSTLCISTVAAFHYNHGRLVTAPSPRCSVARAASPRSHAARLAPTQRQHGAGSALHGALRGALRARSTFLPPTPQSARVAAVASASTSDGGDDAAAAKAQSRLLLLQAAILIMLCVQNAGVALLTRWTCTRGASYSGAAVALVQEVRERERAARQRAASSASVSRDRRRPELSARAARGVRVATTESAPP